MEGRRTYATLVALVVLEVVLVYAVGGARYEFGQLLGVAVLAVALVKLWRGSFVAWSVLLVISLMPLALAVMTAFAPGASMGSSLVVAAAMSAPILAVLLAPPMRSRIRYIPPRDDAPAVRASSPSG
jgi:hypothetical protein